MHGGGNMSKSHGLIRWLIAAVVAAAAAGAVIAVAGIDISARVPLVLIFLVAAPALSITSLLSGLDRLASVVIAGISTIVVNFAVAETMIISGDWSLRGGAAAVAIVSALIALVGLVARRGSRQVTRKFIVSENS
jgi:hypothetical protein